MALSNLRIISKIIFCLLLLDESNPLKLNVKCWKVDSMALSQVFDTTATISYQYKVQTAILCSFMYSLSYYGMFEVFKWIFVLYLLCERQIEY